MDDDRTVDRAGDRTGERTGHRIASSGFVVTPETVNTRTFTTAFRGFDQGEVKAFLKRVAEELGAAAEREAQLRRRLAGAESRAAHPEVDEALLTNALGEHAARLLSSAREEAASIRTEAETRAGRQLRDAEAQIARIRQEADSLLARRVEEVDGVSANLRKAAETETRELRERAKADAEAEVANARNQGREMVAEARAVRERVLADLARRRHIAEVQLDQLRAARERLLSAYSLVRRTLDEATQELKMAEVEARLAADEAARRRPEPPAASADVESPRQFATAGVRTAPATSSPQPPTSSSSPAPSAHRPSPPGLPRRPEPPVARAEPPRMRPPGRPDEPRPTASPLPPRQSNVPTPITNPAPPRPPAPTMPAPTMPSGASASAPAPVAPPRPPSILPRPVPPPPARSEPAPDPTSAEAPAAPPAVAEPEAKGQPTDDEPWPATSPDRVDALFARIKADRASETAPPAAPGPQAPVETPEDIAQLRPRKGDEARHVSDESARNRRDEMLLPIEESLTRQLKRVLQDEQNEVLDRLRRKRRRNGGALLPPDEQAGRFREAAEAILDDAVRAGVRFANPNASEAHADDRAGREVARALATEIVEPLRARLERVISDSGEERDGGDVSESVSAVYRQWRGQELEPIARHHAAEAFARGAYAAFPDGAALRWLVDDDGPCPDCDDNELAATVLKGQAYPTGQLHPPAHRGCRCVLVSAVL